MFILLCNPKVHHRVHKTPRPFSLRSHLNLICFFKIHFNSILPSTRRSSESPLTFSFSNQNFLYISNAPVRFMYRDLRYFDRRHNVWWRVVHALRCRRCEATVVVKCNAVWPLLGLWCQLQWCHHSSLCCCLTPCATPYSGSRVHSISVEYAIRVARRQVMMRFWQFLYVPWHTLL
jgi:hypothetical protein